MNHKKTPLKEEWLGSFAAELKLLVNCHVWNKASCNNKGEKFTCFGISGYSFLKSVLPSPKWLKEFSVHPFHIAKISKTVSNNC